jgi:GT2 family glycosyltransferase
VSRTATRPTTWLPRYREPIQRPSTRGVSIVVPNWNGEKLLAENLPFLLEALRRHPGESELIVVDDCSTDGSRDLLRHEFPTVRVERQPRNQGFGPACLRGARAARHPFVALVNSDVRVKADFLAPLLEALEEDPLTFAASPLFLDPDGRVNNLSLRVPYVKRGKLRFRHCDTARLRDHPEADRLRWYTLYPLGGTALVDRRRFLELGGFDPLFHPFYFEDQDLGFRAWRRGWCCKVAPASRVVHASSSTILRFFGRDVVRRAHRRNRPLLLWKNSTSNRRFLASVAFQAQRVLLAMLRLDFSHLGGTVRALRELPAVMRLRRDERKAAVRSDPEILYTIEEAWRSNERTLR